MFLWDECLIMDCCCTESDDYEEVRVPVPWGYITGKL